jgi:Asp-tRNA(Asn)/Glu-tRNA(Gln) amidotransferase A subunit family amidase
MNRKTIIISFLVLAATMSFLPSCSDSGERDNREYSLDQMLITEAENLLGISFDTAEKRMMQPDLVRALHSYNQLRSESLDNGIYPALVFNPILPGKEIDESADSQQWFLPEKVARPESDTDLAFMSVGELAYLIRTAQITSTELTRIYLNRLREYGDTLKCVITITENLALEQAAEADREIADGKYRGPLHGIPYGVKDLLAVEGYKTTWGAGPYREQVRDETATVVRKLEEAGAVLVAKLSMGALAMGDIWYEGRTLNPWNMEQGSSGSSAGSASATAAGLVAFSIGTETLGSIVSPSTRCGVTGLRPTFGRVSRSGAMALSWSMDKIGPVCRSAADAALVFGVIRGSDGKDPAVIDMPFNYRGKSDMRTLRIGYLKSLFDEDYDSRDNDLSVLQTFTDMGVTLIPVEMDFGDMPVQSLRIILTAEAAAAFDELTRSDMDTLLTRQGRGDWPNTFRAARFIPAVEYIQANRHRTLLMREMEEIIKDYDVIIAPTFRGNQLLVTNLTGNPCCVVPNGFDQRGNPTSISFIGGLFDEASVLMAARAYQEATDFDEQHPPLFSGR